MLSENNENLNKKVNFVYLQICRNRLELWTRDTRNCPKYGNRRGLRCLWSGYTDEA